MGSSSVGKTMFWTPPSDQESTVLYSPVEDVQGLVVLLDEEVSLRANKTT
jgi:hypothetical protein